MNATLTLRRLRAFLSGLAAALFVGAVVELSLAEHVKEPLQFLPFALCGLGLVGLAGLRVRPGPRTTLAVRVSMVVIAAGSLLGVATHIAGNLAFARETRPDAGTARLLVEALTGAAPLLAPGILAVAAALVIAATYAADVGPAAVTELAREVGAAGGASNTYDSTCSTDISAHKSEA